MQSHTNKKEKKQLFFISSIGGVIASLCCLTPVILVLFGLSSVAFAASLGDLLYGTYKWAFRGAGLVFALLALFFYFRRKGICTLDEYKKNRNKVINIITMTVITLVVIYLLFTYVILELVGFKLKLWSAPILKLFSNI